MMFLRGEYRIRAAVACCALAFALAGCAQLRVKQNDEPASLGAARVAFEVSGRLSAHHYEDAFAAGFRWRHEVDHDEMELASPLGQIVARLSGGPGNVELRNANGEVVSARDWPALTARGLGWPLPIDGMAYWIQGVPREGAPFSVERDSDGRPSVLRQDGWTIAYQAFSPGQDGVTRPARMTLSYPEVEVRLAIDDWQ